VNAEQTGMTETVSSPSSFADVISRRASLEKGRSRLGYNNGKYPGREALGECLQGARMWTDRFDCGDLPVVISFR